MADAFGTGGQTGRNEFQCGFSHREHYYKQARTARQCQQHLPPFPEGMSGVVTHAAERIMKCGDGLVKPNTVFGKIQSRVAGIPFEVIIHWQCSRQRFLESQSPGVV